MFPRSHANPNPRYLWIALFAALQLLLQPMATTAWCSVGSALGADCCCSPVADGERDQPSMPSCCAPKGSADLELEPQESPRQCECKISQAPLPASEPLMVQESRADQPVLAEALGQDLVWRFTVPKLARFLQDARRSRGIKPIRLRTQVFRL